MSRSDRFVQPTDAIRIVSKFGRGTLLPESVLAEGRRRVEAGEDAAAVALELAHLEVDLLDFGEEHRALEFNPEQPRDERGQWTSGGGTTVIDEEKRIDEERRAKVERRAADIAKQMGVNPSIINVVDKEPREFQVGNLKFHEAGHYDPRTGMIEINARNSYDDRMSVTQGIAAHEVSHAIYDAARAEQAAEHEEISNLPKAEIDRLYRASGYVRPETRQEVHDRWPVSAAFYQHIGDSYLETEAEQQGESRFKRNMDALEKADGVSDYSRAYWQKGALSQSGGFERAVNETLAEVARYQMTSPAWEGKKPDEIWTRFRDDLQRIAGLDKVKKRLSGRKK